jgi:hypothetical protein
MDDRYDEVKRHFAEMDGVTVSEGRGAQGVKVGKKMFAMFYKGDVLLRLPPARVAELLDAGLGKPYEAVAGSPMADRVIIPAENRDRWIELSEESLAHCRPG